MTIRIQQLANNESPMAITVVATETNGNLAQDSQKVTFQTLADFIVPLAGGVIGPSSAADNDICIFNGINGKAIKDSGLAISEVVTTTQDPAQVIGSTPYPVSKIYTTDLTAVNTISGSVNGTASNVTGVVTIAHGGTNSSTALSNNRAMISYGGSIVESPTITTTELALLGTATSSNAASTLIERDINGDFAARTITANLAGNSYTANALASNGTALQAYSMSSDVVPVQGWHTIPNGTVTTVSVTTNAGISGTVANATTTPAISLSLGDIMPTSVNGITVGMGASDPTSSSLHNTAIGKNTLQSNTTGMLNTGIGESALFENTTGGYNTGCGISALYLNVTGSNNTALGDNSGPSTSVSNTICIGSGATTSTSNTTVIGNTSTTNATIYGALSSTSFNGLTLTSNSVGFEVSGGTTSKTLTVPLDASVSGTNTGDQTDISGNAGTVTNGVYTTSQVTVLAAATGTDKDKFVHTNASTGALEYSNPDMSGITGTTSNTFTIDSDSVLGKIVLDVENGAANKTLTITNTALTGDHVATFQDATGTIAYTSDIPSVSGFVTKDQTTGQTIGDTTNRLTKLWATDITVTNAITGSITGASTSCSGNASTVTTNANLTGVVTSVGNATSIASGAIKANMLQTTATDLGAANTTIDLSNSNGSFVTNITTDGTITATAGFTGNVSGNAGTVTGLTFSSGKTLTVNNILTLAGTDSTTMTFPTTSATLARTDAANTFTGVQTMTSPVFNTNITTPIIKPAVDSTTAVQVMKADGITPVVTIDTTNSRISIGTTPSSVLTLKAGTATAGTAPLKLTSGTLTTIAEAGAVEYDGNNYCFTAGGTPARLFLGFGAGGITNNLIIGTNIGTSLSTGQSNILLGDYAGELVADGGTNIALGKTSLYTNVSGNGNIAIGYQSCFNTISNYNVGIGENSLFASSTAANYNTGIGYQAGQNNVNGYANVWIGKGAGVNASTSWYNSIGIGADCRNTASNEIVIGQSVTGNGANTVTIGNASNLRTYLTGIVLKAGTATAGTAPLKLASGTLNSTPEVGAVEYNGGFYLTGTSLNLRNTDSGNASCSITNLKGTSVSTSTTAIAPVIYYGALAIVQGNNGGNIFTDLVFYSLATTTVISSNTVSGSPVTRTYTASGGILYLAMNSGTYIVSVSQFSSLL